MNNPLFSVFFLDWKRQQRSLVNKRETRRFDANPSDPRRACLPCQLDRSYDAFCMLGFIWFWAAHACMHFLFLRYMLDPCMHALICLGLLTMHERPATDQAWITLQLIFFLLLMHACFCTCCTQITFQLIFCSHHISRSSAPLRRAECGSRSSRVARAIIIKSRPIQPEKHGPKPEKSELVVSKV